MEITHNLKIIEAVAIRHQALVPVMLLPTAYCLLPETAKQ